MKKHHNVACLLTQDDMIGSKTKKSPDNANVPWKKDSHSHKMVELALKKEGATPEPHNWERQFSAGLLCQVWRPSILFWSKIPSCDQKMSSQSLKLNPSRALSPRAGSNLERCPKWCPILLKRQRCHKSQTNDFWRFQPEKIPETQKLDWYRTATLEPRSGSNWQKGPPTIKPAYSNLVG